MSSTPLALARDTRQRELWARTAQVAGRLNRAQAELVEVARELIEDRHWGDGGFRSPEHYLVVRAGLSPEHAADVVRIARRTAELPAAVQALDAGELSLDQVAVVARRVPSTHQEQMTRLARHATVPQLRRMCARHVFDQGGGMPAGAPGQPVEAPGQPVDGRPTVVRDSLAGQSAPERRACAKPELAMHYDANGRFHLRYSAPATVGALVEQAIKEAKDALFTRARGSGSDDDGDPARSPGEPDHTAMAAAAAAGRSGVTGRPTHADALEELANRSLASIASTSRASHYRVYLHLSTDGAWVNGGHAIPLRLLGRFVSDGVVQPVWETEGRPVSVGRGMRILPERTRRLVEDRDRGCRFPGCGATRFVEVHHVQAWSDGGATDEDNQVSLCPHHHDALDRGDFSLTGDPTRPDGLVATNRYGIRIRPPRPVDTTPPPGGDPPVPLDAYTPPTGEPVRWRDLDILPDSGLPPRRGG
ncbi:HNH endonuclease [Pedococcus sp. NPDC057267]|uniref:HNH endonuclease signature motif containing protein n=1 Tax=Pedococcus sp. NPDC057267 TaxID=3346077 RepID=UPI00362D22AE